MKLWGGRSTRETDQLMHSFNESLSFDQKSYHQDIEGSIAHVKVLERQGILSAEDRDDITRRLEGILSDLDSGTLTISSSSRYEDIHSFIEGTLTERIGEAGKRLHTGRSRSGWVALDMKLYIRDRIDEIEKLVEELLMGPLAIMEASIDTFMPDFAHLQKAQPITLAHRMGTYLEMFSRDRSRLQNIRKRMNYCPLGFRALASIAYPLNREYTAVLLGFGGPTLNSMSSVADRNYLIKLLSALSTVVIHLSRFCEEIIIWNANEYRFMKIGDSCSMGSSIIPQKRNPDTAELIRDKSGRICSALVSLLTTMKGVLLAYNKDMQKDEELTFDVIDTAKGCLALFTGMISSMSFHGDVTEASAKNGLTGIVGTVDYLVNKGVPFRDARGIAGQLVLLCTRKGIALDDLSLEEYGQISPVFEGDIYEAINMKTCVEKCVTIGAPGQEAMKQVTEIYRQQSAG